MKVVLVLLLAVSLQGCVLLNAPPVTQAVVSVMTALEIPTLFSK